MNQLFVWSIASQSNILYFVGVKIENPTMCSFSIKPFVSIKKHFKMSTAPIWNLDSHQRFTHERNHFCGFFIILYDQIYNV